MCFLCRILLKDEGLRGIIKIMIRISEVYMRKKIDVLSFVAMFIFLIANIFFVIYSFTEKSLFKNLAIIVICLSIVLFFVYIFLKVICFAVQGAKNISKFSGNNFFSDIDICKKTIKNDEEYYNKMIYIINSKYNSEEFRNIVEKKRINELIKRKVFLERNVDFDSFPLVFFDTILYSLFTTFFCFFVNNFNELKDIIFLVILCLFEIFIMFYRYSDFIKLDKKKEYLDVYELEFINSGIKEINQKRITDKEICMMELKYKLIYMVSRNRRKLNIKRNRLIDKDLNVLHEIDEQSHLCEKEEFINIILTDREYKLYYYIQENKDKIIKYDSVTECFLEMVNKYNLGKIEN